MSGSDAPFSEYDGTEFKVGIACECYSDEHRVREALAKLPDINGQLVWNLPGAPDPIRLPDADLVLIVSDQNNLSAAIARSAIYAHMGRAHILIYLKDGADGSPDTVPGLVLPRSQLADGLLDLTQILLESVATQGLVGIDWADVRTILAMEAQIVMVKVSADKPEVAIKTAVSQLQACASGRPILGLQGAILSHGQNMRMEFIQDLHSACEDVAGHDAIIIVAAPPPSSSDTEHYEVRLFSTVECTENLFDGQTNSDRRIQSSPNQD